MANTDTNKYQKLTHREHILKRPGMYVGNILNENMSLYVADESFTKIWKKEILFNAGFLKLFDEILTNASDHCIRTNNQVKNIYISINSITNEICVKNDGPGIPINKKDGTWLPQMLFGELLTGENYDDTTDRFVGGMNGIGACLVNILSKKFVVDCADGKNTYFQEFSENLSIVNEPKIKKNVIKSYTSVTYCPDLHFFNLTEISNDLISFMRKRAMDIAVYCKCNVYFNDVKIPVKTLAEYAQMHILQGSELFYERLNDNYEIAVAQSQHDTFEQCSIVNGISTYKGGTHVDHIMNQIVKRLIEDLTKGNKGIKIKAADIKSKFHLFLVSRIANPIFDSQTKENLSIKITDKVDLSDKLYKQLMKSEIIQSILEWVQMKEQLELNKMNKKSGGKTIRVEKLVDAHKAGTVDGWKSSLCIAEGDSAKGSVLMGLGVVGRDYWGVFPIKGRPLNVRDVATSKIVNNDEISNLLKIIGLVPGKKYTSVAELRYGKIVFFTDADCFEENTIVLTKDGEKMIKDLTYDDYVLTHTGKYQKIINIIESIKSNMISFIVSGTEYLCSEYHKLIILRNSETYVIYAKDLLKTDCVLIKRC